MKTISADQLLQSVGLEFGPSPALLIEQSRIDAFAEATNDHQWIHVDAERAAAGPFGCTIAHGFLTLSLVSHFLPQILQVEGFSMQVNYGTNKVRFINPVTVGSQLRASGKIESVTEVNTGLQAQINITLQADGVEKPACVAEFLVRFFP